MLKLFSSVSSSTRTLEAAVINPTRDVSLIVSNNAGSVGFSITSVIVVAISTVWLL